MLNSAQKKNVSLFPFPFFESVRAMKEVIKRTIIAVHIQIRMATHQSTPSTLPRRLRNMYSVSITGAKKEKFAVE